MLNVKPDTVTEDGQWTNFLLRFVTLGATICSGPRNKFVGAHFTKSLDRACQSPHCRALHRLNNPSHTSE